MSQELQSSSKEILSESGRLIASAYLFIDQVEMPPELKSDELANFVELHLEEASPFAIEQLLWGYVCSPDGSRLIICATLLERLSGAGYAAGEEQGWVLPDFISLLHVKFDRPTRVWFEDEDNCTECCFESNRAGPVSVRAFSKKMQSKREQEETRNLQTIRLLLPSYRIDTDGHTHFELSAVGDESLPEALQPANLRIPSVSTLWQADLRAPLFKEDERNRRRLSGRLTRLGKRLVIATLVLVPLQFLLIALNVWQSREEGTIAQRAPAVKAIMEQQNLTQKLNRIAASQWADPITVMEAINQYRPVEIHFDSVTVDSSDQISLEGVAATVDVFNRYIAKLEEGGVFALVNAPKTITRSGETSFIVTLKPQALKLEEVN